MQRPIGLAPICDYNFSRLCIFQSKCSLFIEGLISKITCSETCDVSAYARTQRARPMRSRAMLVPGIITRSKACIRRASKGFKSEVWNTSLGWDTLWVGYSGLVVGFIYLQWAWYHIIHSKACIKLKKIIMDIYIYNLCNFRTIDGLINLIFCGFSGLVLL